VRKTISIADFVVGGDTFAVMAGPCAVETKEQLFASADAVAAAGAALLRGGASDDAIEAAWRSAMWMKAAGHGIFHHPHEPIHHPATPAALPVGTVAAAPSSARAARSGERKGAVSVDGTPGAAGAPGAPAGFSPRGAGASPPSSAGAPLSARSAPGGRSSRRSSGPD
jgi:hypothetical protein